jgi:uncharacterized protein
MKYNLITRELSGIVYELAKKFATSENHLILVSKQKNKLKLIAKKLHENHSIETLNIQKNNSLPGSADEVFRQFKEKSVTIYKHLDNAGFYISGAFSETSRDKEYELIQLHCIKHVRIIKLFLPEMLKKKEGGILNICSTGSFMPGPYNSIYCAAIVFLLCLSETLVEEVKDSNIHFTALCPGGTRNAFQDFIKHKYSFFTPLMNAQALAQTGHYALMKGKRISIPELANKMQVLLLRFLQRCLLTRLAGMFVQKTMQ